MPSKRRTIYLIKQCELIMRSEVERRLNGFSVTGLQYTILSIVDRHPNLSVADLARLCRVAPQSMNEVIATLGQKGVIERRVDPANRRILRISLTDSGHALLAACDGPIGMVEEEMFGALEAQDLLVLRENLERVIAAADVRALDGGKDRNASA